MAENETETTPEQPQNIIAKCESCGEQYDTGESEQEKAVEVVKAAGWTYFDNEYTCDTCLADEEEEVEAGDEDEEEEEEKKDE